jgi:hypothetical protein
MSKHKFPLLAILLLIFGVTWLAQDLGYLNVNILWIPVILIVVAISMIWNRLKN